VADALIKSGRSSLQIFCAGAILTVIVNLIVAVDRPSGIERLILDWQSRDQNFRRMLTSLIGQKSPIIGSLPAVWWMGWK